ncbi:hypothetical protein N9903_01810 [bacterium]|nr:hypothetical protein [bacterium]
MVVLRPKEPFIEWVRNHDEESEKVTADEIVKETVAYMLHDKSMEGEKEKIIKDNYRTLFESELNHWFTDEESWPKKRDRKKFNEWFHVEFHGIVYDLSDEDYILE